MKINWLTKNETMKNIWTAMYLAILMIFMSCSSNSANKSSKPNKAIQGAWEMREQVSSMRTTYPAGNGNRLEFADNAYQKFENGALVQSGAYKIISDSTASREVGLELNSGEFTHRIIFDNDNSSPKTFFQITGNKLVLLSGFFPSDAGVQTTYEKVD